MRLLHGSRRSSAVRLATRLWLLGTALCLLHPLPILGEDSTDDVARQRFLLNDTGSLLNWLASEIRADKVASLRLQPLTTDAAASRTADWLTDKLLIGLREKGFALDEQADHTLAGSLSFSQADNRVIQGRFQLRKTQRIIRNLEFELGLLPADATDPLDREGEGFLRLTNHTTFISPTLSPKKRFDAISEASHASATGLVAHNIARATRDGVYGVSILVRKQPNSLRVIESESRTTRIVTRFSRGDEYVVRLINDSDFGCCAELFIDQINVLDELKGLGTEGFFLDAHSSFDVAGWYFPSEGSDRAAGDYLLRRFRITPYEESARAKLGLPTPAEAHGVISAVFRHAWPEGTRPPPDEASAKRITQGGDSLPDLTGYGDTQGERGRVIKQHVGVASHFIHIQYISDHD